MSSPFQPLVVNLAVYPCSVLVLPIAMMKTRTTSDSNQSASRYSRPRGRYCAHRQYNSDANNPGLSMSAHLGGNWGHHHDGRVVHDRRRANSCPGNRHFYVEVARKKNPKSFSSDFSIAMKSLNDHDGVLASANDHPRPTYSSNRHCSSLMRRPCNLSSYHAPVLTVSSRFLMVVVTDLDLIVTSSTFSGSKKKF